MLSNFVALGQTMYEKALQFLQPSVFWRPRGPPCRISLVLALMYSEAHSINVPNFVPFWKFLYEIPAAKWG